MTQRNTTTELVEIVELVAGEYVLKLSNGAYLDIEIPKGERAFICEKALAS